MKKVYFDYAATTPVDPKVVKAMIPFFTKKFGNTMSLHDIGCIANDAVEKSRKIIASAIHAKSDEIIFTASATESNNLALKGIAWVNKRKGNHIIISAIEHDCVQESAHWLSTQGFEISIAPVDSNGIIRLNKLKNLIKKTTILVSVIHASNEIGTIQDITAIGKLCRERNVFFHTDASQSFGKIPIDVSAMNIDLLTGSSHKMYGPKGAAFLYRKTYVPLTPLLHGGGHEKGLRSSTLNVPAIVGFGKAVELCLADMKQEQNRLTKIRDYIIDRVLKTIQGSKLNGHPTKRLANNINISFPYVEGESLILGLNELGIACSTGSACSSKNLEPSHVLMAIGLPPQIAHGSLRITLGRWTTNKEVDYLLQVLPEVVSKFRKISPFKNI